MNNKKKIHEMKEFIYQTTKKELQLSNPLNRQGY